MNDRAWDGLETRMLEARHNYPGNVYLRYRLLEYYTIREQWDRLEPLSRETVTLFTSDPQAGPTVQYWANAYLVLALAQMGRREDAALVFSRLDNLYPALEAWNDNVRMQDRVRRAREILKSRRG
jgi:hypothetical protein